MLPAEPYSLLAPHYERLVGGSQFERARRNFEQAARRNSLHIACAADIGCGPGLFARYLAGHCGVPVFAVDRSPEMLALTSRRCSGLPVRALMQDIRALDLPLPVDFIAMLSSH